jgi:hypothetical protein
MGLLADLAEEIRRQPEGPTIEAQRHAFFRVIAELERRQIITSGQWNLGSLQRQ